MAMRGSVGRIMVIDDLADRPHDCDLVLDQNLVAEMHTRYAGRVPATCGMLVGPEYALVHPSYAETRGRTPPRGGAIRRILVYFGGADRDNVTGRSLSALLSLNRPDIEIDVVITPTGPHAALIARQVEGHPNIHLHGGLATLAPLMAKADLGLGAGGATNWERLCMGLPTLVVTLADNQRAVADGLDQRGLIQWLGHQDEVQESDIARALGALIQNGLEQEWPRRCSAAVDGRGTHRVCAALTATTPPARRVRDARLE
jgi:UDP-2,4-diacetamido-2,4,6-trideoxy-beta-L-altropyranose hydrolase